MVVLFRGNTGCMCEQTFSNKMKSMIAGALNMHFVIYVRFISCIMIFSSIYLLTFLFPLVRVLSLILFNQDPSNGYYLKNEIR